MCEPLFFEEQKHASRCVLVRTGTSYNADLFAFYPSFVIQSLFCFFELITFILRCACFVRLYCHPLPRSFLPFVEA